MPEQHTDFIFTVVGEELGFVGGAARDRALRIAGVAACGASRVLSSDFFGTLVTVGVLAMFAFQVFENIGMTLGIMPITGLPLPFMSYGGSAAIASFAAIGLVAERAYARDSADIGLPAKLLGDVKPVAADRTAPGPG